MTAIQPNIYKGPRTDEYETPDWIINPLREQYDFACDLAATRENKKAPTYFAANASFLDGYGAWNGIAWCNPPFSLATQFFEAIAKAAHQGARCVCIYKSANMETVAWRHIFSACAWIAQPHQRVNYIVDGKAAKAGVQFPSAVIGFNVQRPIVPWPHTLLLVAR